MAIVVSCHVNDIHTHNECIIAGKEMHGFEHACSINRTLVCGLYIRTVYVIKMTQLYFTSY